MFRLPEEINEDMKRYKDSLREIEEGKISSARFKGIRVPWGIYSHRGGKVYMTRIRVPAGLITPKQLDALAKASKKYGNGILHLTTRQDIQIHDVKIEDTIKVMEYLKQFDLSPRGGGGNTVRNVIACSLAGVCEKEIFDVRKYAVAITEYLLRQDDSFNLPRKFKISFSGCPKDCVGSLLSDLGFFAEYHDKKRGFKVFVGGGMGADSRIGKLLEEFIPEGELGYSVQAVKNIFYKKGDRKNKHRNRLRFLIEEIGFEEFKKFYTEEFQALKKSEHIALRKVNFSERAPERDKIPEVEDKGYKEFLQYSVSPQKQEGFLSIELRIPKGDISHEKLSALGELEKDFPGIGFRTSQNQNIIITWVRNRDTHGLYLKIKDILDDFLYARTILDIVVCKGASTCNLGLCDSPALAKEIENIIKSGFIGKNVFRDLDIKLNGCPNACGHQPIGKLSFHGMVRKVDKRPVPFYKFLLGGRREGRFTRFAEEAGILPAKNVPEFLNDFLNRIEEKIHRGGDVYEFLCDGAKEIAKDVLETYQYVPTHSENKDFYIDWGRKEEFSLAGLGQGECGAGVMDIIESDLTEASLILDEAEKKEFNLILIKKVLFYSARALLVVKGSDPKNESDAFSDFKEKFIDKKITSDTYSNIKDVFGSMAEESGLEDRRKWFQYAKGFLIHIKDLYKNMDSSFNFPKQEDRASKKQDTVDNVLDLKGTPCPINYVKAKLYLEGIDSGSTVEIILDEGEPMDNVPKSLENDGHKILKIDKEGSFYRVLVKKK